MRRTIAILLFVLVMMNGSIAVAHPHHQAHSHGSGFDAGLLHPLLGLDHLLAMLTVGILAAKAGGRAVWLIPSAFLLSMIAGGIAGMNGAPLWGPELGIAASVIVLGAIVAVGRNVPLSLLLIACCLFGFYHGHAHGAEMPSISQPALYATGFVLATAGLHLTGIAIGRFSVRSQWRQNVLRFGGAAIALAGVSFLF